MRRGLELRDQACCRFPGCTQTRYLHAHHVHHWADGGETKLSNLILLCTHHHHLVHEGGFGCYAAGDVFRFTTPDGAKLPDAFALPSLIELGDSARSLESGNGRPDIDGKTCIARHGGDTMDYDLALGELGQCRVRGSSF